MSDILDSLNSCSSGCQLGAWFVNRVRGGGGGRCATAAVHFDRRPPFSISAGAALVGFGTVACGTTPIDAVVTDESLVVAVEPDPPDAGSSASSDPDSLGEAISASSSPDACESVSTPVEQGVYQIKVPDEDNCLAVGMPVNLTPTLEAIATSVVPCNSASDQLWELISAGPVYFEIRSVQIDWNLDTALAGNSTGTRLVLYDPHGAPNQQFLPRVRLDGHFEFSPLHGLLQCLTRGARVELSPCSAARDSQEWELVPRACL